MATDEELLQAFYEGDDEAFERLARRLTPLALSVARCVGVLCVQDRLEVVQDAWVRVVRTSGTPSCFNPAKGSVRGWFRTIVRNQAVDHLRRNRPRPTETGELDPPDERACTEEQALQGRDLESLRRCLGRLGEPYLEVLQRRQHGETLRAIGESLGAPPGSASDWANEKERTARRRLRHCMEEREVRGSG